MTTQSIVCGSCNAAVPYGRLSCPECGELLASVAGSRRVVAGAVTTKARSAKRGSAAVAAVAPSGPPWVVEPEPEPAAAVHADRAPEPFASAPEPAAVAAVAPSEPSWVVQPEPVGAVDAWDADSAEPEFAPTGALEDEQDEDDDQGLDEPPWVVDALPLSRPEPNVLMSVAAPTATGGDAWSRASTLSGAVAAPGAYVPPPPIPAVLAGAPAPARTWAGHADSPAVPTAKTDHETTATRIDEFVRWLAVAGSALSAVGFLLPMAAIVIGASGTDYLARWGLAGPFHLVVVVALLAVLGLALAADRVPLWIRVGLPGLGLGALLLGLVWPYLLVEALDAGPGAFAIVVGALMLGVAGVVAIATDRHGSHDRPV